MTDWKEVVNFLDMAITISVIVGIVAFCFIDQLLGIYYYLRSLF